MAVSSTDILEQLSQALRRFRCDWAFTGAFVLTLALGIAANAAVFTALDAYFLRPLAYPDGGRLVDIYFDSAKYPLPPGSAMSAAAYERLRSAPALSSSGLVSDWGSLTVSVRGEPAESHHVVAVSASTMKTLNVRPLLGRWISRAADLAGGPAEVDVSYRFWQSAFHAASHVLGRRLRIGGKAYTVVGVMPPHFDFPARRTQLWVSTDLAPGDLGPQQLTTFNWVMIARLKRRVSRTELDAELGGLLARIDTLMPPVERRVSARMGFCIASMSLRQLLGGATRARLLMMQLGAGVLLLLAVASLVNLALARALRRRDEAALRVVLGAGRGVLLAQACIEALPLGTAATLIAWPLTEFGLRTLAHYRIASASTTFDLHMHAAIWLIALVLALVLSTTALVLPQLFVRVARPAELLHGAGKGGGGHRLRPLRLALSVGQIGLAIALLAGALLLGRSLRNMLDSNPGFSSQHLYAAMLRLQGPQYDTWGGWLEAHRLLAAAVAELPGVGRSAIGEAVPFGGTGSFASFRPAHAPAGNAVPHGGSITQAGPGFLRTLGVRLLAGRLLDANDVATNAPNVVIDERFADALFGSPEVVGKTLKCSIGKGVCRIVGVVDTIRDHFAQHYASFSGTVFVPEDLDSFRNWGGATTLLIRSSAPPAILAREVREIIRRTLPGQSLLRFTSMHELIGDSAQGAAALASLLIAFGLLAFTLAVIGTYGVVAYVTGLRRQEFAVRQAVGAAPAQIESLVLGQGFLLWVLGSLVGVGCALVFARELAAQLYRVSIFSPGAYALPAVVVGVAVMLASWVPARGARKLEIIAQIQPE